MDPVTAVGLAASAAQLAQWAFYIVFKLPGYYRNVRDALEKSKELREELNSLWDLMSYLVAIFERTTIEVPQSIHEEFDKMQWFLYNLDRDLAPENAKGLKRLKWPFDQKKNSENINKIERFKGTINTFLNCRQMYSSV